MAIHMGLGPGHAIANTTGDQGLHHGMMVTISMPTVLRVMEKHVPENTRAVAEALGGKPESALRGFGRSNERKGWYSVSAARAWV